MEGVVRVVRVIRVIGVIRISVTAIVMQTSCLWTAFNLEGVIRVSRVSRVTGVNVLILIQCSVVEKDGCIIIHLQSHP